MPKNIRKRRDKLWIENMGKCHWCSITTILPTKGNAKENFADNFATLDHLRSRLDKNRTELNNTNEERTVLSCRLCNGLRGLLDQRAKQQMLIDITKSKCKFVLR